LAEELHACGCVGAEECEHRVAVRDADAVIRASRLADATFVIAQNRIPVRDERSRKPRHVLFRDGAGSVHENNSRKRAVARGHVERVRELDVAAG
jgi:hypothetical protein